MTFKSITNSITAYFVLLAATNSFVVRFDDDPTDTPSDDLWMEFSVDFGDANQIATGVKQFRYPGLVTVRIRQVVGSGTSNLLSTADIVAEGFRTAMISGVNFQVPKIKNVGRVKDDWMFNVICPFFIDEN